MALTVRYGEVKIIMKPYFEHTCAKGVDPFGSDAVLTDSRVYTKPFATYDTNEWKTYNEFDLIFRDDALKYTFRKYSELPGTTHCWQTYLPPSWCNIQLHLGCNIELHDILAIIVPGYLKNRLIHFNNGTMPFSELVNISNATSIKYRIIYAPEVEPPKYYSIILRR